MKLRIRFLFLVMAVPASLLFAHGKGKEKDKNLKGIPIEHRVELSKEQKERIKQIREQISSQIKDLKELEEKLVLGVLDAKQKKKLNEKAKDGVIEPNYGLIGRTFVNGKEIGLVFRYEDGKVFDHKLLERELLEKLGNMPTNRIQVIFQGRLNIPDDIKIKAWFAGGSPTRGVHTLYIDDKRIGTIGDDRTKNTVYELPLKRGTHLIKWELTGGHFGTNLLKMKNSKNNRALTAFFGLDEIRALGGIPERKVIPITQEKHNWPEPEGW